MPDEKLDIIQMLTGQVIEYVRTRTELFKLTTVAKASELISSIVQNLALYLIASRTVLLLSIAAGFLLGEWLGKYSYGFLIVGAVFAFAGIFVYLRRGKWLKEPVARIVITNALD